MGRMYSAALTSLGTIGVGTSVSTAVDLFEILAATAKPFWLHRVVVGQTSDYGDAQAEGLGFMIKRATSGYTSGSGGSTITPRPHLTNDAAAGATVETANSTQAVAGGGTLLNLFADAANVQAGYDYTPIPEDRYLFLPGEACIISITVPADAILTNATAIIEEL